MTVRARETGMFEWDDNNVDHIAEHGVNAEEVEEAFADPDSSFRAVGRRRGERRWALYGKTDSGRILFIVYTRRHGSIRTVTARDATTREKQTYHQQGK